MTLTQTIRIKQNPGETMTEAMHRVRNPKTETMTQCMDRVRDEILNPGKTIPKEMPPSLKVEGEKKKKSKKKKKDD